MAASPSSELHEPQRKSQHPCNPRTRTALNRRAIRVRPKIKIRAEGVGVPPKRWHRRTNPGALLSFDGRDADYRLRQLTDPIRLKPLLRAGPYRESPAWYVHRQRTRPVLDTGSVFSSDTFRAALDASPLKNKVKYTLLEMLEAADEVGRTAVSGRKLAARLRVREATISSHLERAREAELLLTQRRYNTSSIQQLTWPDSGLHPLPPGISPLNSHAWTDGEVAWWSSLGTDLPQSPPWGEGRPPF